MLCTYQRIEVTALIAATRNTFVLDTENMERCEAYSTTEKPLEHQLLNPCHCL